jgi:hypothetical protein
MNRCMLSCLAMLALTGCATVKLETPAAPDYSAPVGFAANSAAHRYAGCIQESVQSKRYDVTADGSGRLLRFTCTGSAAGQLYEALAGWSKRQHSEWTGKGRTWRSTQRIQKNLFGADYCSSGGAGDFECVIVLNVGQFLDDDAVLP